MNISLTGLVAGIAMALAQSASAAAEGLPDVLGIQLGMPARDAYAKLQAALPKNKVQVQSVNLPTIDKPVISTFTSMSTESNAMGVEADQVQVYVTLPPNKQMVWQVARRHFFPNNGIPKASMLASLREKYGKEARATDLQGKVTTDDKQITALLWLMDEQGHPVRPPVNAAGGDVLSSCQKAGAGSANLLGDVNLHASYASKDYEWCLASYTAVNVLVVQNPAMPELYNQMEVGIISWPIGARAADATWKWRQDIAAGRYKQELEKAKEQEKPPL